MTDALVHPRMRNSVLFTEIVRYVVRNAHCTVPYTQKGQGGQLPPPPRSFNPITIEAGADYAHHVTTPPWIFRPSNGPAMWYIY